MSRINVLLIFAVLAISSCYYDSEEDLYPADACNADNISFQNDIQPILLANCLVCHSAAANLGNVNMEGYTAVLKYVNNGSFLGSVQHGSGFSPMPKSAPKMDACRISKIQSWIQAGSPNN